MRKDSDTKEQPVNKPAATCRGTDEPERPQSDREQQKETFQGRIAPLTRPLEDAGGIEFEDMFDLDEIQRLQDQFADATGVASLITHTDGTPITRPSHFCRMCNDIIRQTEAGRRRCYESDARIAQHNPEGPTVEPCLGSGLWHAGASITVGGRHIANWLIGQVRNETQTEESMRTYAREMGVDEQTFIDAFYEVPTMSRERFYQVSQTLFTLANQISRSAYQNVQQTRLITQLKEAEEALRASEEKFRNLFDNAVEGVYQTTPEGRIVDANMAYARMAGYESPKDVINSIADIASQMYVDPEQRNTIAGLLTQEGYLNNFECPLRRKDGTVFWAVVNARLTRLNDGTPCFEGFVTDITERKQAEAAIRKYSNDLKERNKELNCLYSISEIVRRTDFPPEKILQECSYILSQAFQFPEIAACQITWGHRAYNTENFRKTPWILEREIMIHGVQTGTISICYLEERFEEHEGPFLAEERKLLNSVADLLGRSAERKQAKEEREKLISELQDALGKVKTLSGFLPICTSCKKIRDDKGYWEQIEVYITEHSEALFSHGLCPECARKLYPQLYEKK